MRLSGLASGMDTDAMVESLMKVERMKVDRYEQSKQISMWRQEAYNNINKSFANFILNTRKEMGLNKIGSTGVITSSSYKNLDYMRKVTSSDETKVSVSATSKAVNGSYSVEVVSLGKGASFGSAKLTEENGEIKDIIKGGMTFKINNSEEITVGKSGDIVTMNDVVKAINSAKDTEGNPLGVTAFYDETTGRLFMQSEHMADKTEIVLGKTGNIDGDSFIDALQSGVKGTDYTVTEGKNATIKFNGMTLTYESNNINLNGINMELKATGTVDVKVATNVDGIMEKIQKFVDDYNKLLEDSSKLLEEKRYKSFHPLSQEEKKAMHEDDVDLWMEKAKSGMLSRDENVTRTLQNIRSHIYKKVEYPEGIEGSFNHITQIGITTEKYSRGTVGGKLEIDEEKLRQALTDDPEGVMELLFKDGEFDSDGKEIVTDSNNTSMGVFSGIYNKLTEGMKSIIDKSGTGENASLYRNVKSNILLDFVTEKSSISDIDKAIMDMDKKIDNLNALLDRKEDRYYAQFTQMEKYLQKMNSQSGWLAQQFM